MAMYRDPQIDGIKKSHINDIYYFFIESSWKRLFSILFTLYIISNCLFAAIYYFIPSSINGNEHITFSDAFFFSVQTMSTIGYGALSPAGILTNIVVTIEAAFGLIGVATITGLIFAKLSKPNSKIIFSNNAIISKFNGQPCLSFRIGNGRGNDIVEAKINVTALIDEETVEGSYIRKVHDLKLTRNYTPFFKLSWSIFHPIDEQSPLYNLDLSNGPLKFISITISGHDGTFSNTIYARQVYAPEDILENRYFKDIMSDLPDGRIKIDYTDFHTLV
jgi:inward rectifier potassium channel